MAGFMPLDIPNDEDDGFRYEKAWILVIFYFFYFFYFLFFFFFQGDIFLKKFVSIYDRDNNTVSFGLANHSGR